jgi:lipopolysaccharide assembly protein A
MRWVHLTVIVLFAAFIAIFALQNLKIVPISFLGFGLSVPIAVLVVGVYALGAVTGGSLIAMLRRSYEGSRRTVSDSRHP